MRKEIMWVVLLLQCLQSRKLALGVPLNLCFVAIGIVDIYFEAGSTARGGKRTANTLAKLCSCSCIRMVWQCNLKVSTEHKVSLCF